MAEGRTQWRWWVVPLLALIVWGMARDGDDAKGERASPSHRSSDRPSSDARPSDKPTGAPDDSPSAGSRKGSYEPARYARQVRTHAREAGISPRLLMAILYNEAYKPHDPELEWSWQRFKPDAAFGIANMHRAAFDETKRGKDFASRSWEELPDDRDLALKAPAWHLHDLAAQLGPDSGGAGSGGSGGGLSRDELLALGYNAGSGNMQAFARGVKPGSMAQSYLDKLRGNWAKAGRAVGG
ncbi:lytic transglycosylase domain-containing protein [Streptomyces sp. NBC_01795]|uniref:lytic transglycosylase domain-containing protein n=1 Tax=Streptomyces sp. NBC_01795 TaxID=2975943 RepID=UPI002DDA9336|nr:lytic transglycosylase domain-containing protein [Streptomyces sp. NBC_01795]WSA95863.1 lytic transglycosylase domain-containing protein [Streptomyces sp. NBC_01795]